MFKWLLYLSPKPPQYDRISWKEKFDYFAPYWGIPILGPAGAALWFRDEFTQIFPGFILSVSTTRKLPFMGWVRFSCRRA